MLNANLLGCGTFYRALWFGRVCARNGHQVTLCTVSRDRRWTRSTTVESNLTVSAGPNWGYYCMPGYGSNWLDIAWRWHEIRSADYDILYAFEYHPNVAWPVYAGRRSSQLLLSDWCDWYAGAANVFKGSSLAHAWDRRREERIRLKADRVSVISTPLYERARSLGIPAERLARIPEGIDSDYMKPFPVSTARARLGIDPDAVLVAALNDGAAFPHLVDAFARVHQRLPGTRLLFVGAPSQAQRRLIDSRGLTPLFHATGRCSDEELPLFLSAADVFALPMESSVANTARFPHKIGDYLACGRALAVTNVGDYPALLKQADAALVADSLDSFPDALFSLVNDAEQRRYYAQRGRAWVQQNLDWRVLEPAILTFVRGTSS